MTNSELYRTLRRTTLFDHVFGLSAVILGLALGEMALRFQQLAFGGNRVKWAIEPLLLAAIVFLVIVVLWLGAWHSHKQKVFPLGEVTLNILMVISPFMVAAGVFPKVPERGEVDLYAHYDQSRLFLFGVLAIGLELSSLLSLIRHATSLHGVGEWLKAIVLTAPYFTLIPYLLLMFVRWRWLNILGLGFVLVRFGFPILGMRLTD